MKKSPATASTYYKPPDVTETVPFPVALLKNPPTVSVTSGEGY